MLSTIGLKSETEGFIIAAKDQAIKTKCYQRKILIDGTGPTCRIGGQFQETVDHSVAECPELAMSECIQRYNKAATYLHWNISSRFNISTKERWYEHEPQTVSEEDHITVLWDMPISDRS